MRVIDYILEKIKGREVQKPMKAFRQKARIAVMPGTRDKFNEFKEVYEDGDMALMRLMDFYTETTHDAKGLTVSEWEVE
jgi:hypothetical protein